MSEYPFQLQRRELESGTPRNWQSPAHWFIFPIPEEKRKEWMKEKERDPKRKKDFIDVVVVSIRDNDDMDVVMECTRRDLLDAYRNIKFDDSIWDCGDFDKYDTIKCDVVGSGSFVKENKKHRYTVKFFDGKYAGKKVKFSIGTHGSEDDFKKSTIWANYCSEFDPSSEEKPEYDKKSETIKKPKKIPKKATEVLDKPVIVEVDVNKKLLLDESYFFNHGMYKKANSCPKVWKVLKRGDEVCGEEIDEERIGHSVLDVKESLIECLEKNPGKKIVETKFNGHRAILEFFKEFSALFSESGRNDKTLPSAIAKLSADYFSGKLEKKPALNVNEAIFDGEMFLKECKIGDKKIVPEIGVQGAAIKGDHPELYDKCKFSYKVFDIIRMNGVDVSVLPLKERKSLLKSLIPYNISERLSNLVQLKDSRGKKIETPKNIFIERVGGKTLLSADAIHKEYCKVTGNGHEGIMLKDPKVDYNWKKKNKKGEFVQNRSGWWKVKEELDVDASVLQACLGSEGKKTNEHLTRYKDLKLFVCDDEKCDNMTWVANTSSGASGGSIKGWKDKESSWDKVIHYPLLKKFLTGKATISRGAKLRKIKNIKADIDAGKIAAKNSLEEMELQAGKYFGKDKAFRDSDGDIALPECIDIPKNDFIVEVVTTEINMDKGKPHLGGPPRIIRVRDDKKVPNDISYLKSLYGDELGIKE